jgi:ABC-type sugar transport system ATPase subunit
MSGVTLSNITKKYGEVQVIHGIDLEIKDGEFCVFVGPSGCGKSTLLRMVAGLEDTTGGAISIGARDVTREDPARRGVAMVFQTYALYPHMTVQENMGFGLRMNGYPKAEIAQKVAEASRILKLDDYLKRKPAALSGGQRQRVSIGRAIVRGPEVFLFDEPLSNLDAELRVEMRVEIARLHKEIGATMIYVTHDQVEAMTLADKIVVMRAGRVEQIGSPIDLYRNPTNAFVAQFIGSPKMNFFTQADLAKNGSKSLPAAASGAHIGIRPEHLTGCTEAKALVGGTLDLVEQLGEYALVHLVSASGEAFIVKMEHPPKTAKGETMWFTAQSDALHLFDQSSGLRIEANSSSS